MIAVQVVRWGVATGQYLPGPGGLIVQLSCPSNSRFLITDSSWRMAENPAYVRRTFRAGVNLAFSEVYDARQEDRRPWTRADFDDSGWRHAKVLGPLGLEPWTTMQPRTIPQLAEQSVYIRFVYLTSALSDRQRMSTRSIRMTPLTTMKSIPLRHCRLARWLRS